ncbi:MAG TPA: 1,4-dihydroxy-2-naphthoate polyprenyltransferase [Rhabdochlamydiaceae bacterium]|nr:1,4-dihydroxy-2-naphthoate polyprenyltransferase [Rhabdochlamydiaceae bacterium]
MNFFKVLLLAIRPKTLTASICPVLMGTAMALKAGYFDLLTFLFTLLTALGIQIGTNLANDYFDFKKGADTSARIGPVRVTQAGLISGAAMKKLIVINFVLVALTGSFLIWKGGLVFSLLIAFAILFAIFYTAGPYSIAYLGLGELFVLIFFGPVAVGGVYYLQAHEFSFQSSLAGLSCGLISSVILMVNNIRDIEEDRKANKKTLAVRFGSRFGKRLFAFFIILPAFLPLAFSARHPFVLLASLTLFPSLFLIKEVMRNQDPPLFNPILGKTSKLLLVYTLIFCFSWMV